MEQVVNGLEQARRNQGCGKPTVLLAGTVKGKGVSFMENIAGWHGKAPNLEELVKSLKELGIEREIPYEALLENAKRYQADVDKKLAAKMPQFGRNYWWNSGTTMTAAMKPTRMGFGESLSENGKDERVVCLGLDISGSITISEFYAKHPERKNRWLSMGIAEQSATSAAAGLAREGKLPVFGTYATFAAARNLDQIRVSICYGNFNVMIAGAHGGVSVGPDGATHQALEDLFAMCGLPNMSVVVPCDSVEAKKATDYLLLKHVGPKYVRFAREATPIVSPSTLRSSSAGPMSFACAVSPRISSNAFTTETCRRLSQRERRSCDHRLWPHGSRGDACRVDLEAGVRLRDPRHQHAHPEAARPPHRPARRARHSRRHHRRRAPDRRALRAWSPASSLRRRRLFEVPVITGAIGVKDRFGDSGAPWELIKEFEVSAEHIAQQAASLVLLKKKHRRN